MKLSADSAASAASAGRPVGVRPSASARRAHRHRYATGHRGGGTVRCTEVGRAPERASRPRSGSARRVAAAPPASPRAARGSGPWTGPVADAACLFSYIAGVRQARLKVELYALRLLCHFAFLLVPAVMDAGSCEQGMIPSVVLPLPPCLACGPWARGTRTAAATLPRGGARLPALPTQLISGLLAVRRPLGDAPARPAG